MAKFGPDPGQVRGSGPLWPSCWVTVTLTYDLVSGILVPGAYLILFEVGIPNLVCGFSAFYVAYARV